MVLGDTDTGDLEDDEVVEHYREQKVTSIFKKRLELVRDRKFAYRSLSCSISSADTCTWCNLGFDVQDQAPEVIELIDHLRADYGLLPEELSTLCRLQDLSSQDRSMFFLYNK